MEQISDQDKMRQAGLLELVVEHSGALQQARREREIRSTELRAWRRQSKTFQRLLRFCEAVNTMCWGEFLKRLDDCIRDQKENGDEQAEWLDKWHKAIVQGHIRKPEHREIRNFVKEKRAEGMDPSEIWQMVEQQYPELYHQSLSEVLRER